MEKEVRRYIEAYEAHKKVLRDFYELLDEDKYDFKITDKSDSPEESLAHIILVQLCYLNGSREGKLSFSSVDWESMKNLSKQELLDEWTKVESDMFAYLKDSSFEPEKEIEVPWDKSTKLSIFDALNEHMILHVGWNLAIMDHLDMPRYDSLKEMWG
jgi:uncharacterized damage-inducible protein DinB